MLAGRLLPLPPSVRAVLGEISPQDTLAADAMPWKRAAEALRVDPKAVVEIPLPAPALPPLPVPFLTSGPLVRMTPTQQPAVPQLPSAPDDGDPALPDQPQ